ncbi:MAG: flagellar L-ring protein [Firmicutes bacterium]|nr:flagellar L-ring protein [Bacillota bacterium]
MYGLTKKVFGIVLGFLCVMLPLMPSASADSLWSDVGLNASMYGDRKAHAVGDTLTIIISESLSANRAGTASNTKTTSTSMNAGTGIFHGIASASAGNSDSFSAKGSLANTNTIAATMTAQVIEVKPNGSLLISGTQSIKQNGEEQKITISGIVRVEDITTNNAVYSYSIGDAKIKIEGNGPIASKQRQGILGQIFNFLF